MEIKIYTPGILQYVPVFYIIWSDDLLSTSEINVVEKAISQDESLTASDKKILVSWLDVKNPPADSELKNWKHTIANSQVKLIESETYPLSTFSKKIV